MRFNWVPARMAAVDVEELEELVLDAWRMVVPKNLRQVPVVDAAMMARTASIRTPRNCSPGPATKALAYAGGCGRRTTPRAINPMRSQLGSNRSPSITHRGAYDDRNHSHALESTVMWRPCWHGMSRPALGAVSSRG